MKPFLIILLLVSTAAFADTLVLKNGKKIQGTIIKEDAESYKIKDHEGIIILVKKSQINPEATVINRETTTPESKPEVKPASEKSQGAPSVADAAREARDKKKGNVRVLTKDDLDKMPEVSIIGTDEPIEERPPDAPDSNSATSEQSEEYWKNETRKFAVDIRRAESDIADLNKQCEELGKQAAYAMVDPAQYVMVNGVWIPVGGSYDPSVIQHAQEVCHQAEQAKSELAKIHAELEEFQDYARRQGALPGWVDPDRVR